MLWRLEKKHGEEEARGRRRRRGRNVKSETFGDYFEEILGISKVLNDTLLHSLLYRFIILFEYPSEVETKPGNFISKIKK